MIVFVKINVKRLNERLWQTVSIKSLENANYSATFNQI